MGPDSPRPVGSTSGSVVWRWTWRWQPFPGSDPGEMARTDPEGLRAAIEGARPFLRFRVERILEDAELATSEGRAKAADGALAAVAEHPDSLVRDQYLMQVAERCHLEPGLLRERLEELRRQGPVLASGPGLRQGAKSDRGRRTEGSSFTGAGEPWVREPDEDAGWDADGSEGTGPGQDAGPGTTREFRPGLEALRLAIHRPEDVGDRLEAALFRDELQRATFEALVDTDKDDLHQVIDAAPPAVRALLVRLTVEEPVGEPDEVVLQLVRDASRQELKVITAEARTSPGAVQEAADVTGWVQELDDPNDSVAATASLVAWLVSRAQTSGREPEA
jgi:DNA primase